MKKAVLILGLLVVLGELLYPPTRIVGDTGGMNPYTVVVYRRQPLWKAVEKIVFLTDDERPLKDQGLIFTRGSEVDIGRLIVPTGVTLVLTGILALIVPGSRQGAQPVA